MWPESHDSVYYCVHIIIAYTFQLPESHESIERCLHINYFLTSEITQYFLLGNSIDNIYALLSMVTEGIGQSVIKS